MKSTTEYFIDDLKSLKKKLSNEIGDYHLPENQLDAKELFYNLISTKLIEQQKIIMNSKQ